MSTMDMFWGLAVLYDALQCFVWLHEENRLDKEKYIKTKFKIKITENIILGVLEDK